MSLAGSQLGHYQLLRVIGSGGMGEVYLATDTRINRQVAIKVIRGEVQPYPESSTAQDAKRLFYREARAVASLDHAHILPLFDYGEETHEGQQLTYMVMPFRPEGTLTDWMRRRGNNDLLPLATTVAIIEQAAGALQHAHNHQIIHQDVKPTNFLIRASSERPQDPDVLLADFGIARVISATSQTAQGMRGTPSYMAPEQWQAQPVPASDQYALAVMAYELLTGRLPFQGNLGQLMYSHAFNPPQPLTELNPRLTPAINTVILRALAKDPAARFPSVAEFAQALRQATIETTYSTQHMPPQATAVQIQPPYPMSQLSTVSQQATMPSQRQRPAVPPGPMAQSNGQYDIGRAAQTTSPATRSSTGYPDHARPAPSRTPSKGLLFIAGLLLLILLAIGGSVLYFSTQKTPTAHHQTTAVPPQQTTSQMASPATTPSPATSDATGDPYVSPGGTLALTDPLHNNDKGYQWATDSDMTGNCTFAGSAYHVVMTLPGIEYCYSKAMQFSNFAYEVQMTQLKGQTGGVILRSAQADQNFYFCAISQNGTYAIELYTTKQTTPTSTLASGSSSAIHQGLNKSNLLAVVARGQTLEFYVNGTKVATVTDSTYTSGYLGTAVHAEIDQNTLDSTTEAAFTSARVWKL